MSLTTPAPRRFRVQRSELAVPATSEHFFEKAARGVADVIFLDLEDAVSPDNKDRARKNAIAALNDIDWGEKTVAVRINGLDTPWAHRDLIEVVAHCPRLDMILLPKAGTAFDLQFIDALLGGLEKEFKREKTIGLEALIESALGLANVEEIAASTPRLEALIFGVGDYSISMQTFDVVIGAPNPHYAVLTDPGDTGRRERHWNDHWHYALARIATACRAFGLRPIDGPYTNYADAEGFRASAWRAHALGFEGKWAIHPSQAPICNEVFTPKPTQVEWARQTLVAMESALASGRGAVGRDGVLLDLAHVKLARSILQRAEATSLVPRGPRLDHPSPVAAPASNLP
jgi:malyl-CoA/(S)-citramalyl-CoA lyase